MLHAGVLPHCFALTLPCLPTRCGVGAKVFARVGLHLLWACLLAGGWGLVFALLPVFVWVFACLLVCACLGLWGSVVPPPLCPGLLACLLACSRLGVGLLACARLARAGWARGRPCWGGTIVSRPILRGVGYFGRPVARKREAWRVGCSRCANTRAHAERGRGEGEGSHRPVQVLAWLGAVGGGGIPCWRAVPIRGRAKLTLLGRGRGALPAVVGFWWWVRVVVAILGGGASSFGCAWWFWWRGAFPLVVGWVGGNDFPR